MLLSDLHAVPPAPIPEGSVEVWLLLVVVLAGLVAASVFLTVRR